MGLRTGIDELIGSTPIADSLYRHVVLGETNGDYSCLSKHYVNYDEYGNLVNANVDTNDHAYGEVQSTDVFSVRLWDQNEDTANDWGMSCVA